MAKGKGDEVSLKDWILGFIGAIGGIIASALGGWDALISTLALFMAIDYFSGMIVAGVFKKSDKTADGGLESRAGWKGLCRKGVELLIVVVANHLDQILGLGNNFVRNAVTITFLTNEALSIIENAGLMGVPIPPIITDAITVLKSRVDGKTVEK